MYKVDTLHLKNVLVAMIHVFQRLVIGSMMLKCIPFLIVPPFFFFFSYHARLILKPQLSMAHVFLLQVSSLLMLSNEHKNFPISNFAYIFLDDFVIEYALLEENDFYN